MSKSSQKVGIVNRDYILGLSEMTKMRSEIEYDVMC